MPMPCVPPPATKPTYFRSVLDLFSWLDTGVNALQEPLLWNSMFSLVFGIINILCSNPTTGRNTRQSSQRRNHRLHPHAQMARPLAYIHRRILAPRMGTFCRIDQCLPTPQSTSISDRHTTSTIAHKLFLLYCLK